MAPFCDCIAFRYIFVPLGPHISSVIENLGLRPAKPFNLCYAGLRSNLVHVLFLSLFWLNEAKPRFFWWFRFPFLREGELEILANVPSIYDVATVASNVPKGEGVSPQRICCVIRCQPISLLILFTIKIFS